MAPRHSMEKREEQGEQRGERREGSARESLGLHGGVGVTDMAEAEGGKSFEKRVKKG